MSAPRVTHTHTHMCAYVFMSYTFFMDFIRFIIESTNCERNKQIPKTRQWLTDFFSILVLFVYALWKQIMGNSNESKREYRMCKPLINEQFFFVFECANSKMMWTTDKSCVMCAFFCCHRQVYHHLSKMSTYSMLPGSGKEGEMIKNMHTRQRFEI